LVNVIQKIKRGRFWGHSIDAGQSPTLARLDAPLAAGDQRHPCTETNKNLVAMATSSRDQKSNSTFYQP